MVRRVSFCWSCILAFFISFIISTCSYMVDVYPEGENIVSYALSWVMNPSIPYVWGGGRNAGDTLEKLAEEGRGTDCSGFVSLVYKHFGVSIPAQSDSINNSPEGRKFYSIDDALPGDVCWWDGHVALYIGQGKIVHTNTADTTDNANLIHVSIIHGEGADYPFPSAFIRFVEDSAITGTDGGAGVFGDTTDVATENMVSNAVSTGTLVTESDLTGMVTEWSLEEYQKSITLMSRGDLSISDQNSLANIKDGMENMSKTVSVVSVGFQVVGIVLMLYGFAVVLCIIFDSVNTFVEVSFVQLITFGHLYVVDSIEDVPEKVKRKKYVTRGGLLWRVCIVEVISLLLVSGRVLTLILFIYNKIF